MNKKLIGIASAVILSTLVYGCNAGNNSTATPTISAAVNTNVGNGSCTGMTGSSPYNSCTIVITWNTNGATNVSLNYTSIPSPLPNAINNQVFTTSLLACQTQVNASSSGTCSFGITYNGGSSSTQLNFTLGTATSNPITVSGS